jgi:hypothetical protein
LVEAYHADEALELLLHECGELKTGSEGRGRHLLPYLKSLKNYIKKFPQKKPYIYNKVYYCVW